MSAWDVIWQPAVKQSILFDEAYCFGKCQFFVLPESGDGLARLALVLFPIDASKLAVVRAFASQTEISAMQENFEQWNKILPCLHWSIPVDLILVYSQNFQDPPLKSHERPMQILRGCRKASACRQTAGPRMLRSGWRALSSFPACIILHHLSSQYISIFGLKLEVVVLVHGVWVVGYWCISPR